MSTVHYHNASVDGQQLFYREAGPEDAPTVVLLHGFPTSSCMFQNLIPLLADRYHIIAPDLLGFGFSDAPSVDDFDYTFDALAGLTAGLLDQLNAERFALFVQDYGAQVGWRVALQNPTAITAIVSQNGNGYEVGLAEGFWKPVRAHWAEPTPLTQAGLREGLTLESIRWQYLHGVPDQSLISPDRWYHDFAMLSRPGNDLVQLQLLTDYARNLRLYPQLHAYLRDSKVPLLVIWGRNDEIFGVEGALAFTDDAPHAEVYLLDGGHFLLESHLDTTAGATRHFLDRTVPRAAAHHERTPGESGSRKEVMQ
ncbi:alpha/beta hydrolase [Amycolatopsis sp. NPDC005232]|uniref:alpha/beta fold hydrolase n=1 Tax=Amycolatopsis sp. NPDC005232 TaxID=3157027 RepID=UPI0033BB20FC